MRLSVYSFLLLLSVGYYFAARVSIRILLFRRPGVASVAVRPLRVVRISSLMMLFAARGVIVATVIRPFRRRWVYSFGNAVSVVASACLCASFMRVIRVPPRGVVVVVLLIVVINLRLDELRELISRPTSLQRVLQQNIVVYRR